MKKIFLAFVILVAISLAYLWQTDTYDQGYFSFLSRSLERETVTLVFGGDVMVSREIGNIMRRKDDFTYFWKDIESLFRDADIAFANFENPVSDKGENVGSIYSFRADPKTLEGLTFAGIDIVSFANNHVWDWGRDAFLDSLARLSRADIEYVGAGEDFTQSHTAKIIERNGLKVAYLGYTNLLPVSLRRVESAPSVAGIDSDQIAIDIQDARERGADIVVTTFHWGEEYETKHNNFQQSVAYSAIDAGSDFVIGHHPHVVQETEYYKDSFIAYSLGNLIFDQNFSEDTSHGQVVRATVSKKGIENIEKIRVNFDSTYVPKIGTIDKIL